MLQKYSSDYRTAVIFFYYLCLLKLMMIVKMMLWMSLPWFYSHVVVSMVMVGKDGRHRLELKFYHAGHG